MATSGTETGTVVQLAKEFSRLLVAEIGEEKVREVIRMNKAETDHGVCHSHDFCDANMVMDAAIKKLRLKPVLWDNAWYFAAKNGFFLD